LDYYIYKRTIIFTRGLQRLKEKEKGHHVTGFALAQGARQLALGKKKKASQDRQWVVSYPPTLAGQKKLVSVFHIITMHSNVQLHWVYVLIFRKVAQSHSLPTRAMYVYGNAPFEYVCNHHRHVYLLKCTHRRHHIKAAKGRTRLTVAMWAHVSRWASSG